MKKALVLGLLMVVLIAPTVSGQAGVWNSSFSVLNLSDTDVATVHVTFYDEAGDSTATPTCFYYDENDVCTLSNPFTVTVSGKQEINLAAVRDLPEGRYSVVVSADYPIAVLGNLIGESEAGGMYYNGAYKGLEAGEETSMFLPGVQWDFYGWYSHFSIQNLTAESQMVDIEIYEEGTNNVCWSEEDHAIPAYASYHLDTEAVDLSACDVAPAGDGYNGSAKITGEGAIAVVDNQTTVDNYFEVTYEGFVGGSTHLYMPDLSHKTWPVGHTGWDSSINIQNIGTADTDVTVTLHHPEGDVVVTKTLAVNEGWLVYLPNVEDLPVSNWANFSGEAESTGEPIVAIVNAANPIMQGMTYSAAGSGTASLAVPVVWHKYYGWDTSFAIQNVGGSDVTLNVTYSADNNPLNDPWGPVSFEFGPIAPGESHLFYHGNGDADLCVGTGGTWDDETSTCTGGETLPEGYLGGAIVGLTDSGEIIAVGNTTNGPGQTGGTGDWSTAVNGVNQ